MNLIRLTGILMIVFLSHQKSEAQILSILCYDQNTSISPNAPNYVCEGSFELSTCDPYPVSERYCPNSATYSCDINCWSCTGGGPDTYAHMYDNSFVQTSNGSFAPYFGNGFCNVCPGGDTLCLTQVGCETIVPSGFPTHSANYGGNVGVSLEQTFFVTQGDTLICEFWAGGEPQAHQMTDPGVFAVDVGFGNTFLRNQPTCPGCIGTTYLLKFIAASNSQTIKFTNWGHICSTCTELVIDNVKLYQSSDLEAIPNATFYSNDGFICPSECVNFTNTSTNYDSCLWFFPGSNTPSSSDISPANICYNSTGSYDATLIVFGNGTSDTLIYPGLVNVMPFPPPQSIMQSGDTLFALLGCNDYQWYYNGNIIPGATNFYFIVILNGNYNVVCSSVHGCESEAAIFDVVGIDEETAVDQMEIFPNPANDIITVRYVKYQIHAVTISNSIGCVISETQSEIQDGNSEFNLDIRSLPVGLYFANIHIRTSNGNLIILRKKFAKQ